LVRSRAYSGPAVAMPRLPSPAVEPLVRSHFVGANVRVVSVLAIA